MSSPVSDHAMMTSHDVAAVLKRSSSPELNSLKRKEPPSGDEQDRQSPMSRRRDTSAEASRASEHVDTRTSAPCSRCGNRVSLRNTETGELSMTAWDAHRAACRGPSPPPAATATIAYYAPDASPHSLSHPPAKRRRAKRTEEERIAYLRNDRYVAQFEAYRVLCGSCNKWIRLRPNSTYCSIPWDAHRKSCLAKKINKNSHLLEERNGTFSKDSDIRKFDCERVLCAVCDDWVSVSPDDHARAIQQWITHRTACRGQPPSVVALAKAATACNSAPVESNVMAPMRRLSSPVERTLPPPGALLNAAPPPRAIAPAHPLAGPPALTTPGAPTASPSTSPLTTSVALAGSGGYPSTQVHQAPPVDARKRNAEQRRAHLLSDELVVSVEPSRAFCRLCQKWVQLRQDSTYCAYPWTQHRGKCLARHERRMQKLRAAASSSHRPRVEDEEDADADADGEFEEEEDEHSGIVCAVPPPSAAGPRLYPPPVASSHQDPRHLLGASGDREQHPAGGHRTASSPPAPRMIPVSFANGSPSAARRRPVEAARRRADSYTRPPPSSPGYRAPRADLSSAAGRRAFVHTSAAHLFRTTYDTAAGDLLTVSALLTYVNAALPADRCEEFDTTEVARALHGLEGGGESRSVALEGDVIRWLA
ncbi:hypothetical protein BD626DRAFT_520872 [Schizophyllum amplum]|uniref:Uncharacterized protein n=1 Tax=Schizophyllum amplum TaxID=97359 RepID=A0A550BUD8_9AGAR|nr:hypothetical protein BD626DRAFT_520872 [Auriculariopsis ampla]